MKNKIFLFILAFSILSASAPSLSAAEITMGPNWLSVGETIIRPEYFYEYWMDIKKDTIDVKQCSEIKMRMNGDEKQEEYYGENIDYSIIGQTGDVIALDLTHYTGLLWNRIVQIKYVPSKFA